MTTKKKPTRDRTGRNNPNWRGGVSSVKTADQILSLPPQCIEKIKKQMRDLSVNDPITGCREWVGTLFTSGYGRCTVGMQSLSAHRVAFVIGHNKITGGLYVCHSCDNPRCVHLDHLFLGTSKDNSEDMFRKGRNHPQDCENNGAAKLTNEKVRRIKKRLRSGEVQRKLAREYGVSYQTINLIALGKTWAKV